MNLADGLEAIYQAYPRHTARRKAMQSINRAIDRLMRGEKPMPPMTQEEAIQGLIKIALAYAQSPAGNRGIYTPHPTTFFNQSRYFDDRKEWFYEPEEKSAQLARGRRNDEAFAAVFGRTEAANNSATFLQGPNSGRVGGMEKRALPLFQSGD